MPRDLKFFYVFRLLATSYLFVPIFVFFKISRGLDWQQIMLLSAVYAGVVIVLEAPTGALADRIGRRASLAAGSLAMVASCLCAYTAESFAMFAVAEALAAVSMTLCSGADSAYLYDLLHAHGRGDEYARREGTATAWHLGGNAIAYAAGGALAMVDLSYPFLVTACTAAAAFFVVLLMGNESWVERNRTRQPTVVEMGEYWTLMNSAVHEVIRDRKLRWIVLYSALVFTLVVVTKYVYQPYLDSRGFNYFEIGLTFSGLNLIAAIVALSVHGLRRSFGEATLTWGLLAGLTISYLLLNTLQQASAALGGLALMAASTGLYSPLIKPIINRQIRNSGVRATILSVESMAKRMAILLVHPAVGMFSMVGALYLCGSLGAIGLVLLLIMSRHSPLLGRSTSVAQAHVDRAEAAAQTVSPSCATAASVNAGSSAEAVDEYSSSPSDAPRTESTAKSCSDRPARAVTR